MDVVFYVLYGVALSALAAVAPRAIWVLYIRPHRRVERRVYVEPRPEHTEPEQLSARGREVIRWQGVVGLGFFLAFGFVAVFTYGIAEGWWFR